MGKKRPHPVYTFFEYDEDTNISSCNVCRKTKIGRHAGNLSCHIQSHKVEHKELLDKIELWKVKEDEESQERPKTIAVNLSFEQLKSACVELCSINGRPYKLLDDSGFRKIIDPIMHAMKSSHAINSSNIQMAISELANKYRSQISSELKNKLFSLKLDIATKMNRSMIGVNAQYVHNSELCLRTLAVKEMRFSHTALYVKDLMLEILEDYGVSILQVYAITSDNGANVIKFPTLMNELQEKVFSDLTQDLDENVSGN